MADSLVGKFRPALETALAMYRQHAPDEGRCPRCGTAGMCDARTLARDVLREHGLERPLDEDEP